MVVGVISSPVVGGVGVDSTFPDLLSLKMRNPPIIKIAKINIPKNVFVLFGLVLRIGIGEKLVLSLDGVSTFGVS